MPGPLPKATGQRRRRNTTTGARSLRPDSTTTAPKLPFTVSEPTKLWWEDVWRSPMAVEYEPSDVHGLFLLADLVDSFWTSSDAGVKAKLATEIRLQGQRYGLSPIDRKRLAWDVARAPVATKPAPRKTAKPDPRLPKETS